MMIEYSKKINEQSTKNVATFLECPIIPDWKIRFHTAFYYFCFIAHGISLVSSGFFVPLSYVPDVHFWM